MNAIHVATLQTLATVRRSVTLLARFSTSKQASVLKPEVHPEYHSVKATCICDSAMERWSTPSSDILVDVCLSCHPLYTVKQKTIDSGGRVEKFCLRFAKRTSSGS